MAIRAILTAMIFLLNFATWPKENCYISINDSRNITAIPDT